MQRSCECPIRDWHNFRLALGLTQREFGRLFGMGFRTAQRYDEYEHHCMPDDKLIILSVYLSFPGVRERLERRAIALPPPAVPDSILRILQAS